MFAALFFCDVMPKPKHSKINAAAGSNTSGQLQQHMFCQCLGNEPCHCGAADGTDRHGQDAQSNS